MAGTIALTSGELEITEALTINGPGDEVLTIDAGENSRILNISAVTGDFTVNGLALTGGRTTGDSVAYYDSAYNGGAIRSLTTGTLTIANCTVSGNHTSGNSAAGGGIFAYGSVSLTNSTVSGNHTEGENASGGGIDGVSNITLTNSTVSGNYTAGDFAFGGGLYGAGSVTLTNSIVSGNYTVGKLSYGGGIYGGDITLTNSNVSGNRTEGIEARGGGINSFGDITLTNSTLSGNHTEGSDASGGGINSFGAVTLIDSTVNGNYAVGVGARGGGINAYVDATFTHSTISGNHTAGNFAWGGGIASIGNTTLNGSSVSGNYTAGYGAGGGGIFSFANVTLTNSTVSGNHTTGEAATGAGIRGNADVTLSNSTVSGNQTTGDNAFGGGIYTYGDVTLNTSTATGNHTSGTFANGAGIFVSQYATLTLSDSIVAGNTADDGRPDLWMIGSVPPVLHHSLLGNNFGTALLVPAPLGSPDINGNLIGTAVTPINPLLGPLADNGGPTLPDGSKILTHAPLPGSPVIDAGNPATALDLNEFDQRGAPYLRVHNGDGVGTARIDMGAIELQPIIPPPALLGDYNLDAIVDAADYTLWRNTLGTGGLAPYSGADGSGNRSIGPEDYAIWKAHYGQTLPPPAMGGGGVAVVTLAESVGSGVELFAMAGDRRWVVSALKSVFDARPTIHPRVGELPVIDTPIAAAARHDQVLLAWVASSTHAEIEDNSEDVVRPSTPSTTEGLEDHGLAVLEAAFGE